MTNPDRSLDSFSDAIITRTSLTSDKKGYNAFLDSGFGFHSWQHPDFAWSGETREIAIERCARQIRRYANDPKLAAEYGIVSGEHLERLKRHWERKEALVAGGIDPNEYVNTIKRGDEKLRWGVVSWASVSPELEVQFDSEVVEDWFQYGMFDLSQLAKAAGDDFELVEEQAVTFRATIADLQKAYNFRCEFMEETYTAIDERINQAVASLRPPKLAI